MDRILIAGTHYDLEIVLRRMKFLTNLLTTDDADSLSSEQVTDLHFWMDSLVDNAQGIANGISDAISNTRRDSSSTERKPGAFPGWRGAMR
ncbi:MAG: hypothetical protein EPN46_02420 [Candidimonas sp.]|nr:MAG: hypothetical protein EPN77_05300 [Candidimonas sp.]TAM22299.1 MAG: hypothetical protein EPN62_12270 [Candidimonas sp.]TAM80187.1 MAG: hypothetical protein EPN46_02420 [Candidimonas sp.]